jgi:hypothetical protein
VGESGGQQEVKDEKEQARARGEDQRIPEVQSKPDGAMESKDS